MAKKDSLNQSNNLTQEQLEHIKNYASEIKTIESFITGVRTLPGFYIGATGNIGWKACVREIVQNAIDESLRPNSPCHYIRVVYDERNQSALIEDTGSGIPHGHIIRIYTTERSSSNYEKRKGEYTSGTHGVGSGVALALSKHFEVSSYILGKAVHVEFAEGIPWKDGEKKIPCPDGRQGTTVFMTPDPSVLGQVNLTCNEIFDLIMKIFPTINIGDRIDFIGINVNGKTVINQQLTNKDGLITALQMIATKPIIPPIVFAEDTGTMKGELMFTWDSDMNSEENIISYANYTPTTGGTHVDGCIDGLCKYLRKYINTFYLPKNSKVSIINSDIKSGLKAAVFAAHLHPVFAGQFKGLLSNSDIKSFISDLVYKGLDEWARKNPNDLQKVCKYVKDMADIRMKSDDSKVKLSNQYQRNSLTGKPKKYIEPAGKKDLELFIVEGDSAMGSTQSGRDPQRQGIFPIRGKILNAFNTPKAKFLSNPEVAAIISLVGGGYGKSFDITKVKWKKIIIMSDADPDGAHIAGLLLRLFLMYMPDIVKEGKLYKAVPPLFGIKNGNKMRYFVNNQELAKYAQNQFTKIHSLEYSKNNPISHNEIIRVFAQNMDYAVDMNILADTLAVDPLLLESTLFELADGIQFDLNKNLAMGMARKLQEAPVEEEVDSNLLVNSAIGEAMHYTMANLDRKAFKKSLEKKYKFVKVIEKDGTLVVQGLVNDKYQYIFINRHTTDVCLEMIRHITSMSSRYFIMDGVPISMYSLIDTMDKTLPSNIKRYKGLGEQSPRELWDSTMNPDTRTLIQYTLESAKEEIENIRMIDSNKSALLSNVKVTRQDLE